MKILFAKFQIAKHKLKNFVNNVINFTNQI